MCGIFEEGGITVFGRQKFFKMVKSTNFSLICQMPFSLLVEVIVVQSTGNFGFRAGASQAKNSPERGIGFSTVIGQFRLSQYGIFLFCTSSADNEWRPVVNGMPFKY